MVTGSDGFDPICFETFLLLTKLLLRLQILYGLFFITAGIEQWSSHWLMLKKKRISFYA